MSSIQKPKDFLYNYLNAHSPTGNEAGGQKVWLDYLKPYIDTHFVDSYGTAVGVINPEAEYKVVIEAHADEIAWYVNYISKDGYIYVIRNGGSDYEIAPSMRATIHAEHGKHDAVFGWPAIHVRKRDKGKISPDIKHVILDGGFSSAEEAAKKGIYPGTVVTFLQPPFEINERFITCRALDNRIGGYLIAQVARKLHEEKTKLPYALYIVNAVQEEIGLRGAQMIAERIKPDVAIITDVTHDTQSPLYNKIEQGDLACGKGPVITTAPAVQRQLHQFLLEIAQKEDIPFQRAASSRSTGTDTDAFAYSNAGVPSALLSVPLKYMHTTVEMVDQADVAHTTDWIYHALQALVPGTRFGQ